MIREFINKIKYRNGWKYEGGRGLRPHEWSNGKETLRLYQFYESGGVKKYSLTVSKGDGKEFVLYECDPEDIQDILLEIDAYMMDGVSNRKELLERDDYDFDFFRLFGEENL